MNALPSNFQRQLTLIAFLLFGIFSTMNAQLFEKTESQNPQKEQNQTQYQQNLQNLKFAVMDGAIDPKEYVVGPGDIYVVSIWVNPPLNLQIPVTPEGSVIIPTVGEVAVAGMHLDAAKKKVLTAVKQKYIVGDASFTLYMPRMFAVTVQGVVKNEGTVYVQATDRVDQAITLANSPENNIVKGEETVGPKYGSPGALIVKPDTIGSSRKIIIRHKDGSQASADLEKYFVQKEHRLNPLLQDGDVIIVPKRNIATDFIGVYGAVNGEGAYEFVQGDSLLSVLKMAKGLTELADSGHIEITRSDDKGNLLQMDTLDLNAIVSGRSHDVPLQRGDRIVVREKMDLRRDYKVYVEGEVLYPGYYPITKDSTTLSDIVRKAGGFKETSLLSASQLFRKPISSREISSQRFENARGRASEEDSMYYINESNIRLNGELVVVDFVGLFAKNDKTKDVYLEDGDRISIGTRTGTVYVFGQVVQPGHVAFVKDQNYKYYVNKAGGFAVDAVKSDTRIVKASTKQWLSPDETTIEEGDYVWVPKEPYRPFTYYLQLYSQVFGIVGTIATLAILAIQSKK
jgi:protein involved in polysaccharide export with SLBB domain